MPARATLTFEERADGSVYVQVLTREPLRTIEYAGTGFRVEPEQYLARAVTVACWSDPDTEILLPEITAGFSATKLVSRYLDVTVDGEERELLGRLARQEDIRIVWPNERLEFTWELEPARREYLVAASEQRVDRATWREAVAEHKWRSSDSWRPGLPRPKKRRRRTVAPPRERLPFFAGRSGVPPRSGRPRLAGVALPRGSRAPSPFGGFWCSDAGSEETFALASQLAGVFTETGLWPLLWDNEAEDPWDYWSGAGDPASIDPLDAAAVLDALWRHAPPRPEWVEPLATDFPGLAEATGFEEAASSFDPFQVLHEHRLGFADATGEPLDPRLLLVSCNRPADAITASGYVPYELDVAQVSAVLRSWEERFGAVTTVLDFSELTLAVAAPPPTLEHALRIAAEHYALAPQEDAGSTGALRRLALSLSNEEASRAGWRAGLRVAPLVWTLGWR